MATFFEVRLGAGVPGAVELANRPSTGSMRSRASSPFTATIPRSAGSTPRPTCGPVEVEPGLFRSAGTARRLGDETGGAYDVTTGALSAAWGFFEGPRRVPDPDILADARARTGRHLLRARSRPEDRRVRRTRRAHQPGEHRQGLRDRPGGGRVPRPLVANHRPWCMEADRACSPWGRRPGRFGDRWEVALRNPFRPESPLGLLRLRNRGWAPRAPRSSGSRTTAERYGHILDPRTGEPAIGPASVSVLAPTAAEADALSTAFFLLGRDAAADDVRPTPRSPRVRGGRGRPTARPALRRWG